MLNLDAAEVEPATCALSFEFQRLRLPGCFSLFPARFVPEWEGHDRVKWSGAEQSAFSQRALKADLLMAATKAYNEAQELPAPWALLSLFRAAEAICTHVENDEISRLRSSGSVDNVSLVRRVRSLLSASARTRVENLLKDIQSDGQLPRGHRLPQSRAMISKVVDTRNSIAHGGFLARPDGSYNAPVFEYDAELLACWTWLDKLVQRAITWLAGKF